VKQYTLAAPVTLQGKGLHTGKNVTLTLKPANENTGFVFVRVDLEGNPVIEAEASYVTSTERGTVLEKKGVKIQTCEHILAALVGMNLDNVIMELDAPEPPIMDGSAKYFVNVVLPAARSPFNKSTNLSSIPSLTIFAKRLVSSKSFITIFNIVKPSKFLIYLPSTIIPYLPVYSNN